MAWSSKRYDFPAHQHFLFWCAGASHEYLIKCPATELTKFESIGAIIAITATVASFSIFLAVSIMWPMDWIAPLIVAPVWGAFISVLDRFIVSSMRPSHGFLTRLLQVLPRLLLAALVACIMAWPIELKVFSLEIDKRLAAEIDGKVFAHEATLRHKLEQDIETLKAEWQPEIKAIEQEIDRLDKQLETANSDLSRLQIEEEDFRISFQREVDENISGRIAGRGKVAIMKENYYLDAQKETNKARDRIINLQTDLKVNEQNRNNLILSLKDEVLRTIKARNDYIASELQRIREAESSSFGLLARSQALLSITSEGGFNFVLYGITAIFLIVETAPVLVKLLTPHGPYDAFLSTEYEKVRADYELENATNNHVKENFLKTYEELMNNLLSMFFKSIRDEFPDNLVNHQHANANPAVMSLTSAMKAWLHRISGNLFGEKNNSPENGETAETGESTGQESPAHHETVSKLNWRSPTPYNTFTGSSSSSFFDYLSENLYLIFLTFGSINFITFAVYFISLSTEIALAAGGLLAAQWALVFPFVAKPLKSA
jgi:hypothetical protein